MSNDITKFNKYVANRVDEIMDENAKLHQEIDQLKQQNQRLVEALENALADIRNDYVQMKRENVFECAWKKEIKLLKEVKGE